MTTSERINNLFLNSGKSKRSILQELEFSPTALVEWNKGKSKPTLEAIAKLARYFNVSADYLLCLTDELKPLENREIADRQTTALSTEFAELSQDKDFVDTAKLYKEMPKPDRRAICAYVIGLAQGVLGIAKVNQILGRYL